MPVILPSGGRYRRISVHLHSNLEASLGHMRPCHKRVIYGARFDYGHFGFQPCEVRELRCVPTQDCSCGNVQRQVTHWEPTAGAKGGSPTDEHGEDTGYQAFSCVCVFKVGFCVASCLQTSQISKDDFEHLILLLPPPQCWDDRHVPPYPAPKRYLNSAQMLEKNRGCDVSSYKFSTERQIDLADGLAN